MPCPRGLLSTRQMSEISEVTEALGKWLQTYNWDYFLTITPKRERRDPLAFMRDVWEDIAPSPGWSADSHVKRSFLACEPFFLGHNLHVHGLIAGDSDIKLPWWFNEGFNSRFGRSRVQLCRSQADVSAYCAKYVSKFMGGENYDFFGDW